MTLSIQTLESVIEYRADGRLFWKEAPRDIFPTEAKYSQYYLHKTWNKQNAGKEALTYTDPYGYKMGMIFKHRVKAHQVVWALHHGEWPKHQIDHVNGNPADNRIENLRDVPQSVNCRNNKRRRDNVTGFVGVYHMPNGRFYAQITRDGKTHHLGTFDTFEQAKAARIDAQSAMGFSKRHGSPDSL